MLNPFADDENLFHVIRIAEQAPSVHNTQPWAFCIRADDRIELHASLSGRRLLVADPLSRELAISCGAALFNLRLAFRVTGHDVAVWLVPDPDGDPSLLASVEITTARTFHPSLTEQKLYAAIPRRHTNRYPFTGQAIPATVLAATKRAAFKEQGWLRSLDRSQTAKWVRAAARADAELDRDAGYRAELGQWIADQGRGTGIPAASDGARGTSHRAPVRHYGYAADRKEEHFERHPQLFALSTDGDQLIDWLRAGQALQRALLTATLYGVSASFLTQPMELADRQEKARRWPWHWLFSEVPQLVVRMGYPTRPAAATPRQPAPEVIDLRSQPPRRVPPPDSPPGSRTAALTAAS